MEGYPWLWQQKKMVPHKAITNQVGGIRLKLLSLLLLLLLFSNNLLLITKLTIKTYLQLMSLKKKNYLQVISFHKLLFISILKKIYFNWKKLISVKNNSFRLKMK